jgi:kynurenine formamidase
MEGTWYSGWEPGDDSGPSIMDWAHSGIFTRGVHVNISSVRGTEWVDASAPVKAEDIEAALASGGIRFMPGDALLLDMGRDRFEATGVQMPPAAATELRPGLGVSGVEWIADNDVSVLCWDFLDAVHPEEPRPFAHYLIWATGLAVVDNCDYSSLRSIAHGSASASIGALVMAPLPIPGGSGCNINPLFIM